MESFLSEIERGIRDSSIVPFIGPYALRGVRSPDGSEPLPVSGEELILALNRGRPMAPKLMYEFPRAAMNVELKRGRKALDRFLTELYSRPWSLSLLHEWIRDLCPPLVVDINRDTQLQDAYADTPHILIVGVARIAGTEYRFQIWHYDGSRYRAVSQDAVESGLPILFKPTGTPRPEPTFIASDADYVDYITELMGGFAIPAFLKSYRQGRRWVTLGLPLSRDTERMLLSEIIFGAAEPKGWALLPEPTPKELRFCRRLGLEVVEADALELITGTAPAARAAAG